MTSLRRLSAIGKVPAFAESIVSHLAGTGRPLVVMVHHREAAQQLAGFLDTINQNSGKLPSGVQLEREIRYGMYGWGRSDQSVVDAFQSGYPEGAPPEQRQYLDIFIGSILACREGLNLFRASDTFFLERDWRPLICVQAEDRIHRIGQTNKCVITYFEGSGTIDAKIAKLLMDKTATAARVIDGKDLSEEQAAEEVMGALFGAATEEYASNRGGFDPEDYDWVEPD
jgi:SWI/SNF-related matrix-associated actin-dependent regulator 1 of chromatin subfamily A